MIIHCNAYGSEIQEINCNDLSVDKGIYPKYENQNGENVLIGYVNKINRIELNDYIETVPSGLPISSLDFRIKDTNIAEVNVYPASGLVFLSAKSYGYTTLTISNNNFTEIVNVYVVYPRSGSELEFNESIWRPSSIRLKRNCYAYVLNLINNVDVLDSTNESYWFDPGEIADTYYRNNLYAAGDYSVTEYYYEKRYEYIENVRHDIRALKGYSADADVFKCIEWADDYDPDNPDYIDPLQMSCPKGKYRVILTVDQWGQMHWYRQDSSGLWSHKMGSDYILLRDTDGEYILDPRTCAKTFNLSSGTYTYRYVGCFEGEAVQ